MHIIDAHCPHCGAHHDRSTNVDNEPGGPEQGAVSVCIRCGRLGIFTAEGKLRIPTPQEAIELACDPTVTRAQIAWAGIVGTKVR